jgi:hypothetical protein
MSVALVQRYIEIRQSNDVDKLMELLSPDCVISDADGHEHKGTEAVRAYYTKNPCGQTDWEVPTESPDDPNHVLLNGKVKAYLMWWKVKCELRVSDNLITYMSIKKA